VDEEALPSMQCFMRRVDFSIGCEFSGIKAGSVFGGSADFRSFPCS
jgi:hypothetical protein